MNQSRVDEAIIAFRRAPDVNPVAADAWNNLGTALKEMGHLQEAADAYRTSLDIEPDHVVHSNLLFCLTYDTATTQQELVAEHRVWGAMYGHPADAIAPHNNLPDPARRLRRLFPPTSARMPWPIYRTDYNVHDHGGRRLRHTRKCRKPMRPLYAYKDSSPLAMDNKVEGRRVGIDDSRPTRSTFSSIWPDTRSRNRLRGPLATLAPIQAAWMGYPTTTAGLPLSTTC